MTTTKNPEALRWKNPDIDPIRTRADVILKFGTGPVPDQATVDDWEAQHAAFVAAEDAARKARKDSFRALPDNASLTAGDVRAILEDTGLLC